MGAIAMRLDRYRYRDEWLPNYFPAHRVSSDTYVRLSRCGTAAFLSAGEDEQLRSVFMDRSLFERLEQSGHIITAGNATKVLEDLRTWHRRAFGGPELHIVVLTRRCNLECSYCHMLPVPAASDRSAYDMRPETADAVLDFALQS